MAMVEPWISSSIAPASSPLLRMQSMMPRVSCAGVVRLLGFDEPILLGVEADQIGKRASNIDGNDDHAWSSGRFQERLVAGA